MKIYLWPSLFVLCLLPILLTEKNSDRSTHGNRIIFQSNVTKIDTRKGTPNFPRWSQDRKTILYFTPLNKSGYAFWQLSPITLEPEILAPHVASSVLEVISKSVVYITDQTLHIVEITTRKDKVIALPISTHVNDKHYPISWSPNGRFLSIYSNSGDRGFILVFDIQEGSFTRVADISNDSPISPDHKI